MVKYNSNHLCAVQNYFTIQYNFRLKGCIMNTFPQLSLSSEWVNKTLAAMTLQQKIGQLLHPCVWPSESEDRGKWVEALDGIEIGGLFIFAGTREEFQNTTQWSREHSSIPMIISSDLENGAGMMVKDATVFPDLMSLGAANDEELAYDMGRAAAIEGRECGVHWSFGPVVDMNFNPFNPITNTRCLGDNPDRIIRLSKAMIRGMQEHGMCATSKHFPGGGFDDRDQHICNTINPLRMDQWFALSGRMFQETIDFGVWSIMAGHISLPAWDCGDGTHVQMATPATVSRKIMTGLLREKMGFNGVIITDAMDMGGVTAWGKMDTVIPGAIAAGCDMILFSEVKRDFNFLMRAVEDGRLTEQHIEDSVRRILALKETLGLHKEEKVVPVSGESRKNFQRTSRTIAEKAVTVVKDCNKVLPLKLDKGSRVLSYHFHGDPEYKVDALDNLLRERGVVVTRVDDTESGKFTKTKDDFSGYDLILLNAVFCPSWGTNSIRPAGTYMRDVWALIMSHHKRLILVSYGSPYLEYEMPHLPCVINAYSPDLNTQKAVVGVLAGEIDAVGTSPVDLEASYFYKSALGMRTV